MRNTLVTLAAISTILFSTASLVAQQTMRPVESPPKSPVPNSTISNRPTPVRNTPLQITVDGIPIPDQRARRSKERKSEPSNRSNRKSPKDHGIDADIDSLDTELRHAGADWEIIIEYEVEIEGPIGGDVFVLVLELFEDEQPVIDENGAPLVMEIELINPSERDDDELEFEDRISATVPKAWIGDDDDLELVAKLIRVRDGVIFDDEDESVKEERPRRVGIGIGIGWGLGCGVGVGPLIGF